MGCSATTTSREACTTDAECAAVFGSSSVCLPNGFCRESGTVDSGVDSNVDAGDASPPFEPVLGFVYSSGIDDKGWSQTHHAAISAVADDLGAELVFRQAVPSIDVEDAIEGVIDDGANIIFTASSGYITETLNAANRHPDRFFISCCGDVSGPNVTSYFGRMYQPIYVLGYVAGRTSCTGKLGVVAALPLPQFIRHINAFTLGAREANPDIEVDVRFVGAFFNPEVEAQRTNELIADGADVILAQSNSSAPVQESPDATVSCDDGTGPRDVPVRRIGYHSPTACEANTENCISSAHWNWESLYEEKVNSILEGRFEPTDTAWSSMSNSTRSVVDYAQLAPFVPPAVGSDALVRREATIADPQVPFRGPLNDNTGAERIAAGEDLTDAELDEMCWFVEGVNAVDGVSPAVVPSSCGGI